MDPAPHPTGPTGAPTAPAVVVTDLVVRYGDTTAVDGLSLTAGRGEVVALLGPNGAGKTSTVEAVEGYRAIAGGTVRVLDLDPHRDHARLVRRIGVMLQQGGIYPVLGPARVLDLFARYYDDPEDPAALLTLVGLDGVARTPWRRLSGGERQRLALALALVGRPEVVVLDEPTAGVDPEGRIAVRGIIAGLRDRGLCVVLTTHELAEAERLADRVVIVAGGRVLAEGSPADLAEATADGAVRFAADPGLDVGALATAVAQGAVATEDEPGRYRLTVPDGVATADAVASVAGWLAGQGASLTDLRTGASLEEAYLAVTGADDRSGTATATATAGHPPDRRRGRGTRGRR